MFTTQRWQVDKRGLLSQTKPKYLLRMHPNGSGSAKTALRREYQTQKDTGKDSLDYNSLN